MTNSIFVTELPLESAEQIALRINKQIATEMNVRPQQIAVAMSVCNARISAGSLATNIIT
jgi:hypothetical protein